MRKPLYISLLVILMLISFAVGVRYTQHQAVSDDAGAGGRRILHYVDPMNPANTSKEPGIAPCGMPMEPVYAEDLIHGARTGSDVIGAVTINARKQQIIGVQIGEAQRVRENAEIRALGRVIPDVNGKDPYL